MCSTFKEIEYFRYRYTCIRKCVDKLHEKIDGHVVYLWVRGQFCWLFQIECIRPNFKFQCESISTDILWHIGWFNHSNAHHVSIIALFQYLKHFKWIFVDLFFFSRYLWTIVFLYGNWFEREWEEKLIKFQFFIKFNELDFRINCNNFKFVMWFFILKNQLKKD